MSNIVPQTKTTTVTITSFSAEIISLELNDNAKFRVVIYSETTPIDVLNILLEGDDYKQWSSDDNYVVKYIADKLGFQLC
jgi:hypothetical protein